jgi:DNA-binding protein Fis
MIKIGKIDSMTAMNSNMYSSMAVPAAVRMKQKTNECMGLAQSSDECLDRFFKDLGGMTPPPNLHEKIMSQVEKPLIEHVLRYVRGNQVRAAAVLGINRNTLRKKIVNLEIDIDMITERKRMMR